MSATKNDQYNRLQHFMCCLGQKGVAISDKLRISTNCDCEINTFELLIMYWSVLVCYDPTLTTNCLTQAQIDIIWNDISKKCGICFNPYGQTYSSNSSCGNRITEDSSMRITEDGNQRTLGCEQPNSNQSQDGIDYMYIDDINTPHFIVR